MLKLHADLYSAFAKSCTYKDFTVNYASPYFDLYIYLLLFKYSPVTN